MSVLYMIMVVIGAEHSGARDPAQVHYHHSGDPQVKQRTGRISESIKHVADGLHTTSKLFDNIAMCQEPSLKVAISEEF